MTIYACPKCSGTMEQGFVLDITHGGVAQSRWVRGAPEKGFWTGIKWRDRVTAYINTYRCIECGYLESYAPIPPDSR